MRSMFLSNRNMRAFDRFFDRMTGMSGLSSPLQVVDEWFDRLERDTKVAMGPEDGIITKWEMVPRHYRREVNEHGDITFKLLTEDEVAAIEHNKDAAIEEKSKEAA